MLLKNQSKNSRKAEQIADREISFARKQFDQSKLDQLEAEDERKNRDTLFENGFINNSGNDSDREYSLYSNSDFNKFRNRA